MSPRHSPLLQERIAFWVACGIGADPPTYEHFAHFAAALARIRTRDGGDGAIPFEPNEEQEELLRHIIAEYFAGRPVRVIVLKARQIGITTALQVLEYWLCWLRQGFVVMVMAHVEKSTKNIAGMSQGFARTLPPFARRHGGTDIDGGLQWAHGSKMVVMTQGGNDGARSFSPNCLHISELGRWDRQRAATTAESAVVAALKSLGSGPWTIAVIESTADGAAGSMYDRWGAAESGESGWKPFFFSWVHSSLYVCPNEPGDAEIDARVVQLLADGKRDDAKAALWAAPVWATRGGSAVPSSLQAEWCERGVSLGLRVAQIRFAIGEIYGMFNGDAVMFDQEMPVSPAVAFAASGRRVWTDEEVSAHPVRPPIWTSGPLGPLPANGTPEERLRAASSPGDCIRVWEWPEPTWTHRYAAGSDVAGGAGGGDSTTCIIADRVTSRQVAELITNKLPPDIAADQVARLCEAFGTATVCWEANNHGNVLGNELANRIRYRALWKRHPGAPSQSSDPAAWIRDYGYLTNENSRAAMTTRITTALRTRSLVVVSDRVTAEMRTWVHDEHGRPDHVAGKHDDTLIGAALSLYAGDQMPEPLCKTKPRRDPNVWDEDESDNRMGASPWAY